MTTYEYTMLPLQIRTDDRLGAQALFARFAEQLTALADDGWEIDRELEVGVNEGSPDRGLLLRRESTAEAVGARHGIRSTPRLPLGPSTT